MAATRTSGPGRPAGYRGGGRVPVMSRGARWDVAFVAVAAVYAVSDAVLGLPSDARGLRWALLGSAALAVGLVRRFPVTALVVE